MKLKEIKKLIDFVSERGFAEFEIEQKGFRLRVRRFTETGLGPAPPFIISSPLAGASEVQPRRPEQRILEVEVPSSNRPTATEPEPQAAPEPEPEAQLHIIKSPIVGTFYRSPSPNTDPFVQVGDRVETASVVCIIEAMKLMNEIQAEVTGEIAKIYVEDGKPVEYGQPLFGIKV
jgi:acetyl-CoA carboxylase biotin carboxyl carrier protein